MHMPHKVQHNTQTAVQRDARDSAYYEDKSVRFKIMLIIL